MYFKRVSIATSFCACHYSFWVFGLKYKWIHLRSNSFRHTSCIHKGLHAGNWPDPMTSKPDDLSTLGYHWTDYAGTTLADAIDQLSSNGNPVLICIIGTHWKITGASTTLRCHWKHTGWCRNSMIKSKMFQALQLSLWCLVQYIIPCWLYVSAHFWWSNFKRLSVCRLGIGECLFFSFLVLLRHVGVY